MSQEITFEQFKKVAYNQGVPLNTLNQWWNRGRIPMHFKIKMCSDFGALMSLKEFDRIEAEIALRKARDEHQEPVRYVLKNKRKPR